MAERIWSGPRMFTTLQGDVDVARSHKREARILIGYLLDRTSDIRPYAFRKSKLTDGSMLEVHVWRGNGVARATVRIWSPIVSKDVTDTLTLLLESGLLQIVNEGEFELSTLLHLGDKVTAQYSDLTCICSPENNGTSGARLFPVGIIEYAPKTVGVPIVGNVIPPGDDHKPSQVTVTDTNKAYKLLLPASVFSGKLRLFVQSVYGAKREDFTVLPPSELSGWPTLLIENTAIRYVGRSSSVLITAPNYSYWLGDIDFNDENSVISFTVKELVPRKGSLSAVAKWARKELQETLAFAPGAKLEDEQAILESIVLAELKVSSEVYWTATFSYPSTNFPLGYPLAYGWHTNWDGTEASIVLVTGDNNGFAFGSHTLTISTGVVVNSAGDVVFSASLDTAGGLSAKCLNDFCVWIPVGTHQTSTVTQLSDSIYMCGVENSGAATIPYPAPQECSGLELYGWYDKNNSWVTCSYTRDSSSNAFVQVAQPDSICHGTEESGAAVYYPSYGAGYSLNIGGTSFSGLNGSVANLVNTTASVSSGTVVQTYDQLLYHTYGSYVKCTTEAFPGYTDSLSEARWVTFTTGVVAYTSEDMQGMEWSGRVALSLVYDNCDAAIGISYQTSNVGTFNYTPPNPTDIGRFGALYTEIQGGTSLEPSGEILWSGASYRGETVAVIAANGAGATTRKTNVTKKAVIASLVTSFDTTLLATEISASANNSADISWPAIHPLPSPFGDPNSSANTDWEAFIFAPLGVCTAGIDYIEHVPAVLTSTVYGSSLGKGTPDMTLASTDNFTVGHTFVGFA